MIYKEYFEKAKAAAKVLGAVPVDRVNAILLDVAEELVVQQDMLLDANKKDMGQVDAAYPYKDRLLLTPERIVSMADDLKNIAALDSPVGQTLSHKKRPNGLKISRVRVPLGVVGVIYEARPNVTTDVFAICVKTGNVAVLKGGSDAAYTNQAIITIIHAVLRRHEVSDDIVILLPPYKNATEALLNSVGYVDVVIPRGSQELISYVRTNSKVPVIETGAGIVHLFADESADVKKLSVIICNAKTRRPEVCNSLDCLLIHEQLLPKLPQLLAPLAEHQVKVYADWAAYSYLKNSYPSVAQTLPEHFGMEFLSLQLTVKTVKSMNEALAHIESYSSKHSEAIVSSDRHNIDRFLKEVDAAAVYANASTAFTDGGQFGLGAEIGISTQKLHARGPMGLAAMTTYKWIIRGNGQIRI